MKISYKVLKKYIENIKSVKEIAKDLIMHTAEVEDIVLEWDNLKDVYIWEILESKKHENSDKLNICKVKVLWEEKQIICWANNVKAWIKVPIAIVWAKLNENFIIQKTKIRWERSEWMICSEDELWLKEERQKWIMILPKDAKLWISMRKYLEKDDYILEIDNKAINHRPDLFSHIWIIRELYAINWEKFNYNYENKDFSSLPSLNIENLIPDDVTRYKWLKIENVKNIDSPIYIKDILNSASIASKWLLIDISNYSLYLYWQPTHCFDADKIKWNIIIRYAEDWEKFIALDNNEYKLSKNDIVISDNAWIIALWWIIWWKRASVTNNTTNIIVESAHFNQATVRKTWKRLWIRTDSLNIFEKDIVNWIQHSAMSLIVKELETNLKDIKLTWYSDIYPIKQKEINIDFDLDFINNLIWKDYSENKALTILDNLWIKYKNWTLIIPFWRKDLNFKADIAEEIARIDWYDKIKATIPKINLWAVLQTNIYNLKKETRNFFCIKGFFDIYNYSFVNKKLQNKLLLSTDNLVPVKNALSEDMTHMRWDLIPNLLLSIKNNIKEKSNMKLFEVWKVFKLRWNEIQENYDIAGVITNSKTLLYYDIQNLISVFLKKIWIDNISYDIRNNLPAYSHKWRTAEIIVRWQSIGYIWEFSPKVLNNFKIKNKVWFFKINLNKIKDICFNFPKSKEISNFQENNFDLSFVVDKKIKGQEIFNTILKTDTSLIRKVKLFDIYENKEKLKWKRSLSFKIFIQSMKETLDDKIKNELIDKIINKVNKKWWELR